MGLRPHILGLQSRFHHVQRLRGDRRERATQPGGEEVPRQLVSSRRCPLAAFGTAKAEGHLYGFVRGDEDTAKGKIHRHRGGHAAVQAAEAFPLDDAAQAVADAAVHAQLHPLLHHICGGQDRVVAQSGTRATRGGPQRLVPASVREQPLLGVLIAREKSDVRGDATRDDGPDTAHEPGAAAFLGDGADDLEGSDLVPLARPQGLHVGLHSIERVHPEVLHDARAATRERMLPQRRLRVPLLPRLETGAQRSVVPPLIRWWLLGGSSRTSRTWEGRRTLGTAGAVAAAAAAAIAGVPAPTRRGIGAGHGGAPRPGC
mmetsp:Transcript_29676/g.86091  ORF Transcript_29676/g.86091 Transcript_29676/m.86091 type:complete len:316 (-) Transcript_29676:4-951(-)